MNFQQIIIQVDETLGGQLSFTQYMKNKKHKFGVKVYKPSLDIGYTYDLQVYCRNDNNLLDIGRTIYNF